MYQDYKDLLSAFQSHGVKDLVVGGFAVIYHSQPRFTSPRGDRMGICNGVVSKAKLAMRAKTHQFEAVLIRLAVDENEVGPDVASR